MEDILKRFSELAERFNELHTENISDMEIAEIEYTINEIQKISDAAKALNNAAREFEAGGEYDIDELNKFYRDYLDFQDLMYGTSIDLGRKRESERQALSSILAELREAKYVATRIEKDLEAKTEERNADKERIEEINKELEFRNRLSDSIQLMLNNPDSLTEVARKSLETKLFENKEDIKKFEKELEDLDAKDQALSEEIEQLKNDLKEIQEKISKIEEYKKRQSKFNEENNKSELNNKEPEKVEEKVGIFDFSSSSIDGPDGGSSSSTDSTSSNASSSSDSASESSNSNQEDEEKEYLPINADDQTITIDGKVYIVELDEEATMRNYENSGYGKNAFGWYFDPNTDEYVEGYDPKNDPLFQIFNYYEVVNVLDEEATMRNYENSGYGKNAFGWYFDPNTDEYVEGYDPKNDPLFQVWKEQKVYIGKGEPNKVPTKENPEKGKPGFDAGSDSKGNGNDFDDLGIDVIELPEDKQEKDPEDPKVKINVTINLKGPDDKKTTFTIPVVSGQSLFQDPHSINIYKNACREIFGGKNATYAVESATCNGEPYDLDAPINEEKTIDITVKRRFIVTFVDDNNVVKEVYVNEGEYLDPNIVELVSNQVNYANKDATYLGEQKDNNKGWKLEKAMTGLRYWGVQNEEGKTEKFKFDQPITGNVVLNAKKGIKGKSVAAGLSGVAVGAAIDLANPIAGRVAGVAAGAVDRIAKYKLSHRKELVGYDEIAKMTGIKKASAKLTNHFRKNQTIKNLQYFCRGVMLGVAGVEVSKFVGSQVDKMFPQKNYGTETIQIQKDPIQQTSDAFKGLESDKSIYTDLQGTQANGKPWTQWFDKELHYYDVATGKEIIPGKTPFSEVAGKLFKVVEVQPDGSIVNMGVQRATEAMEVVEKVGGMAR